MPGRHPASLSWLLLLLLNLLWLADACGCMRCRVNAGGTCLFVSRDSAKAAQDTEAGFEWMRQQLRIRHEADKLRR